MSEILLKIYDHNDYLTNVLVPISMDYRKIIFLSHRDYKEKTKNALLKSLSKHNIEAIFMKLADDEYEITNLLKKYQSADIDISGSHYLSLYIFEKTINEDRRIIYFDNEECTIKDYRKHEVIKDKLYSLSISEMISLSGGQLNTNMHKSPNINNIEECNKIVNIVDKSLNNYHTFTNFISNIMQVIANTDKLSVKIDEKVRNRIINNPIYKIVLDEGVLSIKDDTLYILNDFFLELFRNAGAWLESYLYIKIMQSNKFDDCIMSAVIEYRDGEIRYPISCEIDVITIKDNHLLMISCKSNKVDAAAINEIKVHNSEFGNYLSKPIVCTIDDLNVKNPLIYKKAKELAVSIIDVTAIKNNAVAIVLEKILNKTYQYEKVKV